ncbi:MAG: hypothetical protein NWF00_02865 [Candidatus Bathyarchaeota archaeon]|nr:hypothetical protein [Candidatus Bathyarchaeota archaeon]
MKKAFFFSTVLAVACLFPAASGFPTDQSGNAFPIASPVGITSPSNVTYSSNCLILNVSQVGLFVGNIQVSMVYSLDGQPNQTIPLTRQTRENSFQASLTGTVTLPALSDGSHWITVYERIDVTTDPSQYATDQDTVYFTVATATSVSSTAANQTGNSWLEQAAIPNPRYNCGAAVLNGTIYVLGGSKTQVDGSLHFLNYTDANEAYNLATDTWTMKAPLPMPLSSVAVAAFGGKLFCFGGSTFVSDQAVPQAESFVYNPATDRWQNLTAMPVPASGLDAHVVDDKIYLIGNLTMVYDISADSWATKTPLPVAVSNYASAVVEGKIYVIGGNTGTTTVTSLNQIYDPATDTWSQGTPIPTGVSNAAATTTTTPQAIYVLGGTTQEHPLNGQNLSQIYFPENNSWTLGEPMPKTKAGLSAVTVDNVIYALGGGHNIFTPDSTDNMQYVLFEKGNLQSAALPSSLLHQLSSANTNARPTVSPTSSVLESSSKPTQTTPPSFLQQTILTVAITVIIATAVGGVFFLRKKHHPNTPLLSLESAY